MRFIDRISLRTRYLFGCAVLLLLYGYLCRVIPLYFFWESKSIAWLLFVVVVISFLADNLKIKKQNAQNTILEKILIGVVVFFLLVKVMLWAIIPDSDAHAAAIKFMNEDPSLDSATGPERTYSIVPSGGVQKSSTYEGNHGAAELYYIVKGDKKFVDAYVQVVKDIDSPVWEVKILKY